MRRRYDRRRAKAASVGVGVSFADPSVGASTANSDATIAPRRRLSAQMKLHVHGPEFQNGDELVLNPECFPQLKELALEKYVVEIFHATESERLREERFVASVTPFTEADYKQAHSHLLLEVPPCSATPIKGKLQVSVAKDTASAFQLAPFNDVTLRFVEKSCVEVDFVEISLKDQFLSRRDLWYLKQSLVGVALHVGKTVRVQGTRWQVMDLRAKSDAVRSGVVSATTKFAFRSRTSRVMWLLQMSPEMWEIANSGQLYLEILLQVVQNVLNKWIKHKVSHSLTIILFARNYYPELDARSSDVGYGALATPPRSLHSDYKRFVTGRTLHHTPTPSSTAQNTEGSAESAFPFSGKNDDMFAIGVDEDGRHYQDFYKIVAFDSIVNEVEPLLVQLKEEMNEFPHLCGWRSSNAPPTPLSTGLPGDEEQPPRLFPERRRGVPSNARDGNLLEAINIVLNIFDKHHIDRHLARTGQSVVLITAGNGIFRVKQRLAEITEQRMMDHGVGIDMISLSTPPLHKCPLFLFKHTDESELSLPRADGAEPTHGAGQEGCECGFMNPQQSHHGRSSTNVRRSRTESSDLGDVAESQTVVSEFSLRGGQRQQQQQQQQQMQVQTPPAPPQSLPQPLCRLCRGRLAQRKRYEVPLWIPLSFVQERMMMDHKCPLDSDITNSCLICCPLGRQQTRGFEPLPMWRMFNDVATWQDPPRSCRSATSSLPKPLERLLQRFQDTSTTTTSDLPASKVNDDQENDSQGEFDDFLRMRTFSSDLSMLLDGDYLSLGRDSELVRARAPSLASMDDDDDALLYSRSPSAELPKVPSFSATDLQRYRREFESYDDGVFTIAPPKALSRNAHKGGEDEFQYGYARTPPLRSTAAQGATLASRKQSRHVMSVSRGTGSASGGGGGGAAEDGPAERQQGEASRWRSPHQTVGPMAVTTTSPGRPMRGSVHSDSKSRRPSTVEMSIENGRSDKKDGDMASSPELAMQRARMLDGSLTGTYQLLADSGKYGHSPVLVVQPPLEGKSKDAIFYSHAFYRQITSNQRRWSQVRPSDGKNPYRLVQSVLKWKSLCFPALLPLTTDFIPGETELRKHYEHFMYSITLPESDEQSGVTFRDYKELVMEMVAQRFSQDFQLATMEIAKTATAAATATSTSAASAAASTSAPASATASSSSSSSSSTLKVSNRVVFQLSMGHRIHEIMYNEETQTVDLKRYVQRAKVKSDTDVMEYRYSLWSPVAGSFLYASQKFGKYSSEYQWNYLDHLICGYHDEMTDAIRYKRILFCILPPELKGESVEDDTATLALQTERCRKFLEFLKSKAADAAAFPTITIASEWRDDLHRSGVAAFTQVRSENVKIVLHASDSPTGQNWLVTRLDTELTAAQCFHVEVQWLVCRSALVDDFTQGLVRRAKQLGLDFQQVAENGVSSDLDLHPLISPIFLPLRDPAQQRIVEAALVERFQFCCEGLHEIPRAHLNHDDEYMIIDPRQQISTTKGKGRGQGQVRYLYRQYVHRSLSCFVRVTQTGFVWISNRKLQCRDIQPIFEAIRGLVESVRISHDVLQDVVGSVMAMVDEAATLRSVSVSEQEEQQEEEADEEEEEMVMSAVVATEQEDEPDTSDGLVVEVTGTATGMVTWSAAAEPDDLKECNEPQDAAHHLATMPESEKENDEPDGNVVEESVVSDLEHHSISNVAVKSLESITSAGSSSSPIAVQHQCGQRDPLARGGSSMGFSTPTAVPATSTSGGNVLHAHLALPLPL